ncbi:hypothetical protein ACNFCJ_21990 [Pseudomonas sp. NY15364]|uniref:hypothetical protein n=1 Tax=Pseudomonas sp. NY15364 TaxID=3400353 RepID=UPI003A8B0098
MSDKLFFNSSFKGNSLCRCLQRQSDESIGNLGLAVKGPSCLSALFIHKRHAGSRIGVTTSADRCVVEITADLSAFGRIVCLSLLRFCVALLVIDPMSWQIHGEDRGFAIGYKVLRAPAVFRPARRMRKPKTKKPGHKQTV